MIPVAFVCKSLKKEYLKSYINTINPKKELPEMKEGLWGEDYLEGYNQFFEGIGLELFGDIFMFDNNNIEDCNQLEVTEEDVLIGVPVTYFPERFSITRQKLEVYKLFTGIDLISETAEGLEDIHLLNFNLKEST